MLSENLSDIREKIRAAAEKSGRRESDVKLVAVTKQRPLEDIAALQSLGVTAVGENRVQELETKFDGLKGRFEIHFIGHLQTNKAKKAAEMADWIHSVDSLRLAQALDRACASLGKKPRVLIEVNTSGETQKYGAPPEMLPELLNGTASLRNLEVSGLMTMAMLTDNPEKARACFRFLRELRDRAAAEGLYRLSELSMGMSQDYEIAVEEGATLVRVGTALFN